MVLRPLPGRRTAAQRAGDAAEDLVAARLATDGWSVLARNVRVSRHELDLVALDPGPPIELVVVEVRWRRSRGYGLPEETVDQRKRARLRQAAFELLDRGTFPEGGSIPRRPLRFDLVVVEPGRDGGGPVMRHYRAAG